MRRPSFRPTYANITSTLALLLATSGGAYAVTVLPKDSVGTPQLRTGAVTTPKIAADAVTSGKVKNGALKLDDFAAGQLFRWSGSWDSATSYQRMDVVTNAGSSYVAFAPTTGEAPGEFAVWEPLALAGQPGQPGEQGAPGQDGQNGQNGTDGEDGAPGPSYGDTTTANAVVLDPCGATTVASLPLHLSQDSRLLGWSSGVWTVSSPPVSWFVNHQRWIQVVDGSGNLVAQTQVRSGSATNGDGSEKNDDLDINDLVSQPTMTVPAGDYTIRLRVLSAADVCPSSYVPRAFEVRLGYIIVGTTP